MFERASMSFTNGHCVPFGGFWVVNHVVGSLVATNENAPSNIGQYLGDFSSLLRACSNIRYCHIGACKLIR